MLLHHSYEYSEFQSTPSARRATGTLVIDTADWAISIHALREEGDCIFAVFCNNLFQFQSTPSARRATGGVPSPHQDQSISIHALREEGDCW